MGEMMPNRLPHKRAAAPNRPSTKSDPKDVLKERAAAIAKTPLESLQATDVVEVIQFRIGREVCAIETRFVEEVIKDSSITPIPDSASVLQGVMNLRGEILAVMDLGLLLGSSLEHPRDSWIIVIGQERTEFGFSVDAVTEVTTIPVRDILPPTKHSDGTDSLIRGVTIDALSVIDGASLLQDPRLYIDTQ